MIYSQWVRGRDRVGIGFRVRVRVEVRVGVRFRVRICSKRRERNLFGLYLGRHLQYFVIHDG